MLTGYIDWHGAKPAFRPISEHEGEWHAANARLVEEQRRLGLTKQPRGIVVDFTMRLHMKRLRELRRPRNAR